MTAVVAALLDETLQPFQRPGWGNRLLVAAAVLLKCQSHERFTGHRFSLQQMKYETIPGSASSRGGPP